MTRAPRTFEPPPALPEPDRMAGLPHPRETPRLFGHPQAEAAFLATHAGGRAHHAWLIAGPRGIGKATLAWRIARFLLAAPAEDGLFGAPPPPTSLDVDPDHPAARRLRALSEPRNFLLRRGANTTGKALSQVIRVEDVRGLRDFLGLKATDGGARTVIIDSADEMNPNAANAILKWLEEPPPQVTFLIVAHQPARLLPTIRSRCRTLRLGPLAPSDLAAALVQAGVEAPNPVALGELAGGSVGAAASLSESDGLATYAALISLLATLPRLDRPAAIAFAEAAARRGEEGRFDLAVGLIDTALARLARTGATATPPPEAAPGEAAMLARLAPGPHAARAWADLAATLAARARRGKAVNLDPAALILDMLLKTSETAGSLAPR